MSGQWYTMTVGAVYSLVANNGKMDNLLNANQYLKSRLFQIRCAKTAAARTNPNINPEPSLNDIEKTHVLLVNAKYKPFVTTAQEYYKESYNGTVVFGAQQVQIPIPQFGDFFNDMAILTQLASVSATVGTVPAFPTAIKSLPANPDTAFPGTRVSEMANAAGKLYTRYIQRYCDIAGNTILPGAAAQNFVRYCEYPGVRLFKKTWFEVNSTVLDTYTNMSAITIAKKRIMPHKLQAWKKLVGQETPSESYSDLVTIAGASQFASPIVGVNNIAGQTDAASASASVSSYKVRREFYSGPQTPQATQPAQNWWTPLWFWFNTDVHLSIPSAAIPFNNRYIKFVLAQQSEIVFTAPGNLFYELSVEQITDADTTAPGTSTAVAINGINRYTRRIPQLATGSVVDTTQQIKNMSLYINNLFIDPMVHEMYIKRIGFSMVRVHLEQVTQMNTGIAQDLMNMFKYPVEYYFVGAQPTGNSTGNNQWRDWHRFESITEEYVDNVDRGLTYNWVATSTSATLQPMNVQRSLGRDTVLVKSQCLDTIKVYVNAIELYKEESGIMFTTYIPYNFGENTISTLYDDGIHMVNFSAIPGIYQPTGHFNISRANQFYTQLTSQIASSSNPVQVYYVAKAINFLLIAEGSATLRYTA